MTLGFVLINCKMGFENDVRDRLNEIDNIIEVKQLFGAYDFLATIDSSSIQKTDEIISLKIKKISNINSLLPLMTAE